MLFIDPFLIMLSFIKTGPIGDLALLILSHWIKWSEKLNFLLLLLRLSHQNAVLDIGGLSHFQVILYLRYKVSINCAWIHITKMVEWAHFTSFVLFSENRRILRI